MCECCREGAAVRWPHRGRGVDSDGQVL
jgi:hypothetical protein